MKQHQITIDRVYYYDMLRIISIIAVVLIHVSAMALEHYSYGTVEWNIANFYSSISRFAVPVFVMISGALFLNREISIKTIYRKYVLRLVIAYIVFYVLYNIVDGIEHGRRAASIVKRMIRFEDIPYHLWYIVMIIGLYMVLPIIKKIVENKKITRYFCILSFAFSFVLPQFLSLLSLISSEYTKIINDYSYNLCLFLPIGFTGYFVFGYLLSKTDIDRKKELIIYFFGIVGVVSTFFYQMLNGRVVNNSGEPLYDYLNCNLRVNVLLEAAAVFVFFKKHFCCKSKNVKYIVCQLSSLSFGIYLFHLLFINLLEKHFVFLTPLEWNPIVSIIIVTILVLLLSAFSTFIMKKIPLIKKLF